MGWWSVTAHISYVPSGELKLHVENDAMLFPSREFSQPGPIVSAEALGEFEIDKIIDARPHGRGWRYLV